MIYNNDIINICQLERYIEKKIEKKHQKNKRIKPKNLHSLSPSLPTLKLSHYLVSFFALSNIMKDK